MQPVKAVITKPNGKQAESRGFSLKELKGACLTKEDAKKLGIPVDVKRKSFHNENIQTLKAHAEQAKAKAEAEAKPEEPETQAEAPKKKARK